jgi:glycyl-tRNA synthetase beta chain
MAELLFEILGEEMPARFAAQGAEQLGQAAGKALDAAGLTYRDMMTDYTPRRLVLQVTGLPVRQDDRVEEKRGPKADAPAPALAGFARSAGLASIAEAELRDTPKGRFYFVVQKSAGRATADILPALLSGILQDFVWPKSMRWGRNRFAWIRPLHSLLALFDGQKLDGALDLGDERLPFTAQTYGHRFLAPEAIDVHDFADYAAKLNAAFVEIRTAARKATILRQAEALARDIGGRCIEDDALLNEVAGLVEWPHSLRGSIDAEFMHLPVEVLTTSMRSHQKYAALEDAQGQLAPYFITVTNGIYSDAVRAGNERVLRARLADAEFFWREDRRAPLASLLPKLEAVTFHAKLGSVGDKAQRIKRLAGWFAASIKGVEIADAERAAELAKADLVSQMVGEFPELQGTMGAYYARHDKEREVVSQAIAEHYQPHGPSDACPSAPTSIAVALADKLDTLVGFWLIDEKPSGSKDPFALRRAALGILRLIRENGLRLSLNAGIEAARAAYTSMSDRPVTAVTAELRRFFYQRLAVMLRQEGVQPDIVQAVLQGSEESDMQQLAIKAQALQTFMQSAQSEALLASYRRTRNILQDKAEAEALEVTAPLLESPAEQALFEAASEPIRLPETPGYDDFYQAFERLGRLRAPLDRFFDEVMVLSEDTRLRDNRFALLQTILLKFDALADFAQVSADQVSADL